MPEYAVLPAEPLIGLVTPPVHILVFFSEEYFVHNPMDVVRGHSISLFCSLTIKVLLFLPLLAEETKP